MRGLLDLTDNLVAGEVVHPQAFACSTRTTRTSSWPRTRARRPSRTRPTPSPPSTASGSGTPSPPAARRATTTRSSASQRSGAWESVKRHFRELGVDVMTQPFTVVGIGDMSGDVFGNGMLLLRADPARRGVRPPPRLHRPGSRPGAAFAERKRLFELPASSWDDYDRSKISPGGGVWSRRSEKSIPLSPEAQDALGVEAGRGDAERGALGDPEGAGRSPLERRHRHVREGVGRVERGRRRPRPTTRSGSNGADAAGAGSSRRAATSASRRGPHRVRARGAGGSTRTAIDNSAGVDCSDHEVNLKILLGIADRKPATSRRSSATSCSGRSSRTWPRTSSTTTTSRPRSSRRRSRSRPSARGVRGLMTQLEAEGLLEREIEACPSGARWPSGPGGQGDGTARALRSARLREAEPQAGDPAAPRCPDDPSSTASVRRYFPAKVVERFGDLIAQHPLRRDLAATIIANEIVNALGSHFVSGSPRRRAPRRPRSRARTGSPATSPARSRRWEDGRGARRQDRPGRAERPHGRRGHARRGRLALVPLERALGPARRDHRGRRRRSSRALGAIERSARTPGARP